MNSPLRIRTSQQLLASIAGKRDVIRPFIATSRYYATQTSLGTSKPSSRPTRKQITVTSDDGSVKWGQLSRREKVARTTQQSVNFLVILGGAIMTCGVFTFLYLEVFAPDSKTRQFNRAVDRIKDDERSIQLLGDPKQIRAYGEASWNKWTRNRPIASTKETDRLGKEHIKLNFNVSGPLNDGIVYVHMIKSPGESDYQYHLLALDVRGHTRHFLENAEATMRADKRAASKLFGISWR